MTPYKSGCLYFHKNKTKSFQPPQAVIITILITSEDGALLEGASVSIPGKNAVTTGPDGTVDIAVGAGLIVAVSADRDGFLGQSQVVVAPVDEEETVIWELPAWEIRWYLA